MHASASITYTLSPSEMQFTGQASAQAPQLMQLSSILYAISMTPPLMIHSNQLYTTPQICELAKSLSIHSAAMIQSLSYHKFSSSSSIFAASSSIGS